MQVKMLLILKKYAFTIINVICVLLQMHVGMRFGELVSGYYEADGTLTIKNWDEFAFPASEHQYTWSASLFYTVIALILVCTVNNKRMRIILTVISAVVTAFQVVCLVYAV
jgi:hypothetical protein